MLNAAPGSGPDASAEAPVTASPEIVALEARLRADFDKRVAGFQKIISKKEADAATLARQLDELQSASLSPDERATAAQKKLADENAQLRAQIELSQLEGEYGDAMSTYRQLLEAGSAKDQLELIKALSNPKPAETPKTEEVAVPDVDFNNPQRPPVGDGMTDAMADRILNSVGTMASVTQNGARSYSQSGVGTE